MNIQSRLDLDEFVDNFKNYFARTKDISMLGDDKRHFEYINELAKYDFILPTHTQDLTDTINRLTKFATLDSSSIFEIVKIIRYFMYLKSTNFSNLLNTWFSKILIPKELLDITYFFDTKKPEFKDDIDPKLQDIASSISRLKRDIISTYEGILQSSNLREYLIDRQIYYIDNKECLLLRGGFSNVLKAKVISRSSTGYFYVIPDKIKDITNKIGELTLKKEDILFEYRKTISKTLNKHLLFVKYINKEFDIFDHYQARVMFAKSKNLEFILPNRKSKKVVLNSFKHPALKSAVALDITLDSSIMLITGVNAGGKTILLKSILGAVYLASFLLPLPLNADKSDIGYFKEIVPILDDPQNIKNDISTFAGRMVEFSKLFNKQDILVGVDEIELGTDSAEASSLFKSILDELSVHNKIIVTTHHKKLASLMSSKDNVQMIATLYDEKNRKPTYRFLEGTIGKSYAFETARRYKIPSHIIDNALLLHSKKEDNLNHLIEKNIELETDLKKKKGFLNKELKQVNKLKLQLLTEKKEQKQSFESLISSYQTKYQKAINEAKEAVKQKSSKDIHKQIAVANASLSKITQKNQENKNNQKNTEFKVKDIVKYRNTKAEILSIKKNKILLSCEGMKLSVSPDDISKSHSKEKPKSIISYEKPKNAFIKLDIHGLRVNEASMQIENFLNDALLAGLEEVYIYHGIGSGILANFTKELLENHPRVVSYDDATPSMGGYGATVIKL
ncbi:MAG: Recombination inhibitory protein MutS2 [uncultured Campylobacterales bacterium]|uniref:Endonuclease MutS2 n=1 Tax=uncultured Campylobacterales bacterium TaxID=352960 RepID=A0A6S6SGK2_9BACT|nr:MAG: Recombination inhibitory protein MutS2 [uncultured Campylobacterales bacterium]